jgi:hypothetical protein
MMRGMVRLGFAVLLGVALIGCGGEGRLLITLQRPSVKSFDPMVDVRLSRFNLRVIQGSQQSDQETVRTERAELEVGSVPVGEAFDLRLAGKSGTGQMLGLGLVFDLRVPGEDEMPVEVKFRKPIGFVAGNQGIEQLDTTAINSVNIHSEKPIAAPNAADVAASPDGTWIAVVSGSQLTSFLTYDRRKWADVKLKAPGTCVAVSPDSRYAVVCHDDGTLSIVDMDRLAENRLDIRQVQVGGKPTKVIFGRNRTQAAVLVNGTDYATGCSVQSRVVDIDVSQAVKLREVQLNEAVADMAVDLRDGRMLLALPCKSQLGRINGSTVEKAIDLPGGVYDLAVTDQYVVMLGTRPASQTSSGSLEGETVLVDLNKQAFSTQNKRFYPPSLAVWFVGPGGEGAVGWLADTEDFTIHDVSVSPDGQRALALYRASYSSDTQFQSCVYQSSMTAHGMMLLDLTVDRVVYWLMTTLQISKCSICGSDCTALMRTALKQGAALADPEYTPKGTAMLFGGS